ncbi:MAG TPA: UDP-N-acetylglucosamine 2-epimerase (non-hydrolyzing) [Gemmatimonadaceae bacterium]|nr:UDP-N-acetylglucosamine 2-epimerase (non-hydrolyzing) [Gemmatimonadaceae bacterium]
MHLLHVVGARPNLPKLAPVYRAAARRTELTQTVVHTGQHYDDALFSSLLTDLALPEPDINLGVGSASHAIQTARILERLEPIVTREHPDWVVIYGDVNSTAAAAVVAAKLGIRSAHVEAGLRSGDRTMPEEINRIVADRLASLLLTPSRDADETLRAEGEPEHEIVFVGNVMIDSLLEALPRARAVSHSRGHVLVTLHRPSNVDDPSRLAALMAGLRDVAAERPVVFPVHPRTRDRLDQWHIDCGAVQTVAPVGYLAMVALVDASHAVVTDSGGVQEETTALGVPCFTVRDTTERPITVIAGTNRLVHDPKTLPGLVRAAARPPALPTIEGWDGSAGERVVDALMAGALP